MENHVDELINFFHSIFRSARRGKARERRSHAGAPPARARENRYSITHNPTSSFTIYRLEFLNLCSS